jgi:membrane fusion protein, copper/silver efflux system
MKTVRVLLVAALVLGAFGGGYYYARHSGGGASAGGRKVLYWVDPMHPAYKSDKPGIAPDCGMKLVPVYADGGPAAPAQAQKKILYYQDPKDPNYHADKPGLNPETGNDLMPVYDEPAPGSITVSTEKQQLAGVKFGIVESASAESTIRAAGKVVVDETRVSRVSTKVDGWVDNVMVDFTGSPVRKGQALFTLYSPELLASQQEYLLALRSKEILQKSTLQQAQQQGDSLIAAARRRLELWDITDAQIDEIARTGKPIHDITIYSPVSGHVLERKVFPKQRITPEMELYTIADLSHLWVMAEVFEHDAARIEPGQAATVTLSSAPRRPIRARVDYIQPQVDPATRTLKVRLDVANPGMQLKPDMFVDVDFRFNDAAAMTVPVEAVLDTGSRKTVFVDRGGGVLEPRQVQTGKRFDYRVEILSGLKPGERIVVSGNFLIDSESQLNPGVSK